MQYLDDIALFFGDLTADSSSAAQYCDSIPILGGALSSFFWAANGIFRDLRTAFSSLSDAWDDLANSIGDILSWDRIKDYILDSWGWVEDFVGNVANTMQDIISDQYSLIKDFWGNAKAAAEELIGDQYSLIKDFWGNVGIGIGDWFTTDFEDWIEDRAENVANLAGRVLDKVW